MKTKYMFYFEYAIREDKIEKIKKLILWSSESPVYYDNHPIRFAYELGRFEIVKLLWNDKRIKDTLKKDDFKLYNNLMKKDVKKKVVGF